MIKNFRGTIEEVCLLLHILMCPGWNFFWNLISGGCGIRMSWVEIFRKINWRGGDVYWRLENMLVSSLFFLCGMNQTFRATDLLLFFNLSPFFCVWKKNLFFHSYWFIKGRIFNILSLQIFFICLWFTATFIAYWKQLSSIFLGFVVAFSLLVYLQEFMYDLPQLKFILLQK